MPAFLTPEWIAETEALRVGLADGEVPPQLAGLCVNLTVTGGPQGERRVALVGAPGGVSVREGHAEGAHTSVTMPYDACRAMLIDGDQQRAVQSFASGEMSVSGDVTRLLLLHGNVTAPDDQQRRVLAAIRAVTT